MLVGAITLVINKGNAQTNNFSEERESREPSGDTTTARGNDKYNDARFTCELFKNQYTVMYRPKTQPDKGYPWAVPGRLGGGWTSQKRCQEISRRLESYRPDGLRELGITSRNGNKVLCVTTERYPNCRIVLTVPRGKDPVATRNLVFYNLLQADKGFTTEAVKTFVGDDDESGVTYDLRGIFDLNPEISRTSTDNSQESQPINLRPFLDVADGGSGRKL